MPGAVNFFLLLFMHFSYSLTFTYTFFRKLPALMSPRLDSRGRCTLWHPPLHATGWNLEQAPFGSCLRSTGSHHESSTSFGSSRLNRFQLPDIITYVMKLLSSLV